MMGLGRGKHRGYTRSGDLGETSLVCGPRVGKDHYRIELFGVIEELSAWFGKIRIEVGDPEISKLLGRLQENLLVVMTEVVSLGPDKPDDPIVEEKHIDILERAVDYWSDRASSSNSTLLLGGTSAVADFAIAYAVCRRTERRATALLRFDPRFSPRVVAWFNRLSSLLFVLSRFESYRGCDSDSNLSFRNAFSHFNDELV